jgi:hypothetical protein
MRKIILPTVLAILCSTQNNAQSVKVTKMYNQQNTVKPLNIRTSIMFNIPQDNGSELPMNLNLEGHYWLPKLLDIRGGIQLGFFNGFNAGGTFHLVDNENPRQKKFIVSREETSTRRKVVYFKASAQSRNIWGPCADIMVGTLGKANLFYTRIDAGLDWQKFTRAYAEVSDGTTYPANGNGWFSFKVLATSAILNKQNKTYVGVGGLGRLMYNTRPWKKVSFFGDLQMGAVKFSQAIGTNVILYFGGGVSVNLLKTKQE